MSSTFEKPKLSYNKFEEIAGYLTIRIGQIVAAERVPKSNGLKLTVIFGGDKADEKTAFTNLGKHFEPDAFLGLSCPFIMNLEPSLIKGVNSEVMIMVATNDDGTIDLNNYRIGSTLM